MKRIVYESGSEEYALKLEETMKRKNGSIAEGLGDSRDIFAAAFTDPSDRPAIYKLFDSYSHLAECDNDFAEKLQIMTIWKKETDEGEGRTILDSVDSPEEAIALFREIKYLVLRLEFNKSDDGGSSICSLVREYGISIAALITIAEWCCINGVLILISLSTLFLENGMADFSTKILRRVKNA